MASIQAAVFDALYLSQKHSLHPSKNMTLAVGQLVQAAGTRVTSWWSFVAARILDGDACICARVSGCAAMQV